MIPAQAKERQRNSAENHIESDLPNNDFAHKFSLKMGPDPFLFPTETQSNFNVFVNQPGTSLRASLAEWRLL